MKNRRNDENLKEMMNEFASDLGVDQKAANEMAEELGVDQNTGEIRQDPKGLADRMKQAIRKRKNRAQNNR